MTLFLNVVFPSLLPDLVPTLFRRASEWHEAAAFIGFILGAIVVYLMLYRLYIDQSTPLLGLFGVACLVGAFMLPRPEVPRAALGILLTCISLGLFALRVSGALDRLSSDQVASTGQDTTRRP
jgi:hypothetical protein